MQAAVTGGAPVRHGQLDRHRATALTVLAFLRAKPHVLNPEGDVAPVLGLEAVDVHEPKRSEDLKQHWR